jgi:hypothetical protein
MTGTTPVRKPKMTSQREVLVNVADVFLRKLDHPSPTHVADLEQALRVTLALLDDLGWAFPVPASLHEGLRSA